MPIWLSIRLLRFKTNARASPLRPAASPESPIRQNDRMSDSADANYVKLNVAQEFSETDSFTPKRYSQFCQNLPIDARDVLDVGCNTGRGGAVLKRRRPALRIIGLDCVPARLERLNRSVYSSIICGYSTAIPLPDASLDSIVAGEFIEHLYGQDVGPTLREFLRLLRPGGVLLLTTPNPQYLRLRLTGGSVLGGAHLSEHYPRQLVQRLERLGYQRVRLRGSGRVSTLLGTHFPWLAVYGSYLVAAHRAPELACHSLDSTTQSPGSASTACNLLHLLQ